MLLLPKTIGPITLVRKLGTGGVAESYAGTLHGARTRNVVVRRVLPYVLKDPERLSLLEDRIRDLLGLDHPHLVRLVEWVVDGDDRYIVEEQVDGIDLQRLLKWCRANNTPLPGNVYLNLATQICNGLEALHGSRGRGTGAETVVHLGLKPNSIFVGPDGQVLLGGYGLTPSPTLLPQGGDGGAAVPFRMEYLSPEQTLGERSPSPASDIFSLGAILYELLTLEPLFRADTGLQTIHRIRRSEITSHLLKVRAMMPGLDRVLYRALSRKPQHRYQRSFVVREDLRGLMSGYSFGAIVEDTKAYLDPLFSGTGTAATGMYEESPGDQPEASLFSPQHDHTQGHIAHALMSDSQDRNLVELAPDATEEQDDFNDEAETAVGHAPEEHDSLESLPEPAPLLWDSQTSNTDQSVEPLASLGDSSPLFSSLDELTGDLVLEPTGEIIDPRGKRPAPPVAQPLVPPEPVASVQPEPPQADPDVERSRHREANTALRNIRAAARDEIEDDGSDDMLWPDQKKNAISTAAVAAGIVFVIASASTVWWASGVLGNEPESPSAERSTTEALTQSTSRTPAAPDGQPAAVRARGEDSVSPEELDAPSETDAQPIEEPREESSGSSETGSTAAARTSPRSAEERAPTSSRRTEPSSPDSMVPTAAEVDRLAVSTPVLDSPEGFEEPPDTTIDWSHYKSLAERGALTSTDQMALETIPRTQPDDYTRSRALLLAHAQQKKDLRATELYLDQLFLLPENKYDPVYLTAKAQLEVNQQRFEQALHTAGRAELRWQDIPSPLITVKLGEIYEVKARSHQGLFYQSEELDDLDEAIRAWSKYRDHVSRSSSRSLLAMADRELDKLRDARSRME